MCLLHIGPVFPRREQTCVRDRREQHHLGAGSVGTQLLTHMLLCPVRLWGMKLPRLPGAHCPAASAGFPATLTCCGGRSRSHCCMCCRRCRTLASGSSGKLPILSHPCRCRWNTGCSQPVKTAQDQTHPWLPQWEETPRAASHHRSHSGCSSCREVNWRYYFESAQAVRRSESSLQKFLIMFSCQGPGEARHRGRIAVGETVPNEGSR